MAVMFDYFRYISFCLLVSILLLGSSFLAHADTFGKATILLVLQPNKVSGKKWDIGKGADPALCMAYGCYISRGFALSAKYFKGKSALLPVVNARACRNSLICVYRDIELPNEGFDIWPVDLDGFKHDKMQIQRTFIDKSCVFDQRRLQCFNGVHTAEYSLWVVPETVAKSAGKTGLDYALFKGLHDAREAYISSFLDDQRHRLPQIVKKFFHRILDKTVSNQCLRSVDVISEAFYIAGIFDSPDRKPSVFLKNWLLSGSSEEKTKRVLQLKPIVFWKMHHAIHTLKMYADADKRQEFSYQKGIIYRDQGRTTSLDIGWDVKSRAQSLLDKCVLGRSFIRSSY